MIPTHNARSDTVLLGASVCITAPVVPRGIRGILFRSHREGFFFFEMLHVSRLEKILLKLFLSIFYQ